MTDQPTSRQNGQSTAPRPAQPPAITNPRPARVPAMERSEEMLAWVSHYDNTVEQNKELKTTIGRLNTQMKGLEARINTLTDEVRKMTRERNHYQQGYQELRALLHEVGALVVQGVENHH